MSVSDREKEIIERLAKAIGGKYLSRDVLFRESNPYYACFDAVICVNNTRAIAIEINFNEDCDINIRIEKCLKCLIYNLVIITDDKNIRLIEINQDTYRLRSLAWNDLVSYCCNSIEALKRAPKDLKTYFADRISKQCRTKGFALELTADDISIESTSVMLSEDKERQLFDLILGFSKRKRQVCRYTSFSSAKTCIDLLQQNMLSIICMNDKSECYYADCFINPGSEIIDWYNCSVDTLSNTIESYILSLSYHDKNDDLTLWRLYGDDARGASLLYNCPEKMPDGFYLAPVDYAGAKNRHPKLTFLRNIANGIYGYHVTFRHWNVWKHFFKPKEYSVEKEIRLVYIDNPKSATRPQKQWIISSSNSILAPMIIFPFDAKVGVPVFPLKLSKVLLGPKCKEQQVNCAALRYLVTQRFASKHGIPAVEIAKSSITTYRD